MLIPGELRLLRQWVCWRGVLRPDGKITKIPINPHTGQLASVVVSSSWGKYETALERNDVDGIGFVFTKNDSYCGIDLDDPQGDVAIAHRQQRIAEAFDTYSEISPSGRGLHMIAKGAVPKGRRRDKIEIYSHSRFFTMTGNVYSGKPIAYRQALVDMLWAEMGSVSDLDDPTPDDTAQIQTDDEVLMTGANATNGEKFKALFEGRWQELYQSQSEADLSLINMLAYYTSSKSQIVRIFKRSVLGRRTKADRASYVDEMVRKSFDKHLPTIDTRALKAEFDKSVEIIEPPSIVESPYKFPPGLLGELAQYFYDAAPLPVQEIALSAAIGLMAGICGRSYNVSDTGLNLYVMLLAETGRGKEAMASGIDRLVDTVAKQIPMIRNYIGPAEIASGPALIRYMSKSPCFVSVMGEIGYRLKSMSEARASSAETTLRRDLLQIYMKSGKTQTFQPMVYSDKDKDTKTLHSPSLSILGEGTPSTFYSAINEQMIEDGLLPRFIIIEYLGERVALNKKHAMRFPSSSLVEKFGSLAANVLGMANNGIVCDVDAKEDVKILLDEFSEIIRKKINSTQTKIVADLWNRAHLNTMRLASLAAIGENNKVPTITTANVLWAKAIVVAAIERIIYRFEEGEIGAANEEARQMKYFMNAVREFVMLPYENIKHYDVRKDMHDNKVIPYGYLVRKLASSQAFRSDRIGATNAIKRTVQVLMESGILVEVAKVEMTNKYATTQRAFMVSNFAVLK